MTITDLRTGMRVKLREIEDIYIVQMIDVKNGFVINKNKHIIKLNSFLNNFKFYHENGRSLDIVKVYDMPHISKFLDFNAKGKLLWEEKPKPKTELTEKHITAIKGRIAEGYLWVARDGKSIGVYFYKDEPCMEDNGKYHYFTAKDGGFSYTECELYDFVTWKNSPIYLSDLLKGA